MDKDSSVYCTQGPQEMRALRQGALSGLKFAFKDLFDVEGYVTGAGNPTWLKTHEAANATSPIITQLLSSGASCIGRVQTDELAYSLNGQNVHYGTPVNPRAPQCLPGGSSSGSAVAVARGEADFAIGTDTGGSIRVPASYCGLFGLRPSFAALDLTHSFTLAHSFDTAGILAKDLPTLDVAFHSLRSSSEPKQVTRLLFDVAFADIMGVERTEAMYEFALNADIAIERTDFFAQYGWSFARLSELFRTLQGYEIIEQHDAWLAEHGHTLAADIAARVEWARTISASDYRSASEMRADFVAAINEFWLADDALAVLPTTPGVAPPLAMAADALATYRSELMGLTAIAGLAGLPQLHLPLNVTTIPCGFSLLGKKGDDSSLIETAKRFSGELR